MSNTNVRKIVFTLASAVLVAACGSGLDKGGTASAPSLASPVTPPAPVTPPPPAPDASSMNLAVSITGVKTLRFTWNDTDSETSYKLKLSPNGDAANYTEILTIAADTATKDVELPMYVAAALSGKFILQTCNAGGCTDSASVSMPVFALSSITYIKASNTGAGDTYGMRVAFSKDGQTLAVAATFEDSGAQTINGDETDNLTTDAGAVYVYARAGATWVQQAYIKPSNMEAGDRFGEGLSISGDGNTLAVAATSEDGNATTINGDGTNNGATDSGAVYVFVRTGTTWTQQAYIKANNSGPGDEFGTRVQISLDGNTMVAGSTFEDSNATGVNGDGTNNSTTSSGAAYVFTRSGTTWTQQAYLKSQSPDASDYFGAYTSISGDGNTVAIGAYDEDGGSMGVNGDPTDNSATSAGAVYIFTRSGTTWTQQAYIKASNAGASDNFGNSVSLSESGNALLVGANNESSSAIGFAGDQADNSRGGSGAVYLFNRSGVTWTQELYLKAPVSRANYSFGQNVQIAFDGQTFAVATTQDSSASTGYYGNVTSTTVGRSGGVHIYRKNLGTWAYSSFVKAPNTRSNSYFGVGVSFSEKEIAISARGESSAATGINGNMANTSAAGAGAAYIY